MINRRLTSEVCVPSTIKSMQSSFFAQSFHNKIKCSVLNNLQVSYPSSDHIK